MKALSPVIATVIIVAVAIAISVGIALWVTGVIGGLTGGREELKIMPDSNITIKTVEGGENEAYLYLHIKNTGSGDAVIVSIKVAGTTVSLDNPDIVPKNSGLEVKDNTIIATVGADGWIKVKLENIDVKAGNVYTVSVMTEKGIIYQQEVQAYKK